MLARTLEDVQMPGEAKANEITPAFLDAFADAWNRHDVDAILSAMTDDCVFEARLVLASGGLSTTVSAKSEKGSRRCSSNSRREMEWSQALHCGDRGVTEWVFSGTRDDGVRVEVQGCDVFTFRDGKIAVKNSYRKQRSGY